MRDPFSLNEWRVDHGDWVLPFYTSRLVDGGPSILPIYPGGGGGRDGLNSQLGLVP